MATMYDFTAQTIDGNEESLSTFDGKVALVVNVASKCGFTPQYEGLEELYETYRERGLVILGFPCNQFGHQEPGDEVAISEFCSLTYGVSFPMYAKVDVNGSDAHPLYQWLRSEKTGVLGDKVKWNFTKFLVDSTGHVLKRYGSRTKPADLAADIEAALAERS